MLRFQAISLMFLVAMLCSACSSSSNLDNPSDTTGAKSKEGTSTDSDPSKADATAEDLGNKELIEPSDDPPPMTEPIVRNSLEGNWFLVLTQNGNDFYTALLAISQSKDSTTSQYEVKQLEISEALPGAELKEATATKEQVRLTFDIDGTQLDFEGIFSESIVTGNVIFGESRCDAARMVPTNAENFEGQKVAQPSAGRRELLEIDNDDDRVKAMRDFIKAHPNAPLALEAYQQAIVSAKDAELDEANLKELTDNYLSLAARWGNRMQQVARVNIAYLLAISDYQPEIALNYLNEAESQLKADGVSGLHEQLKISRKKILTTQALALLENDDKKKRGEGATKLRQIIEGSPFDFSIAFALAEFDEREGRIDDAITEYAALAVLPRVEQRLQATWFRDNIEKPLPSETVVRLWKEKHENTDGLDEFLGKVYSNRIHSFADERVKSRPAGTGNQTVLCELFTGAQCPPCMPADVATVGLEKTYPKSQVIVLRYHEHIPGPDPLTNEDGEAHFFNFYKGQGTPSVYINGEQIAGIGGMQLSDAENLYQQLRETIDPLLSRITKVRITASAVAVDGNLKVSANVSGLGKIDKQLRLRIVLAEDDITFLAANGIRQHEMTVRRMVGGADGISPNEGTLMHSESIKLAEFKQRIVDYLTKFEEGQGVAFTAKPVELQQLHLVAFVQNNITKEVLQAIAVPVTGKIEYPKVAKSEDAHPEKTKKEDKGKPSAKKKPTPPSDGKSKKDSDEKS